MSLAEQNKVQEVLGPYHADIARIVLGAWNEWLNIQGAVTQPLCDRSRANLVWDLMVQRARAMFDGNNSIRIFDHNQTCFFVIGGSVLLRFKKADQQGFSRNYPTQTALSFYDREVDMFDAPLRVEVVYVLDRLASTISSIQIVARNKTGILWAYEIGDNTMDNVVSLQRKVRKPSSTSIAVLKEQRSRRSEEDKD